MLTASHSAVARRLRQHPDSNPPKLAGARALFFVLAKLCQFSRTKFDIKGPTAHVLDSERPAGPQNPASVPGDPLDVVSRVGQLQALAVRLPRMRMSIWSLMRLCVARSGFRDVAL